MSKPTYKDIARATLKIIDSSKSADKIAREIAEYLGSERRTRDLGRVMREVERLRYERDGVLEVAAVSANELSDTTKRAIGRLFPAKEVKIIERKDKSLVGGVKLQALDSQLDLSVRGQLNRLKNTTNLRG